MDVGDELIYRLRDFSSSERVRIVGIDNRKKTPRYDIEFLDGEKKGTLENIPGGRLRGPWDTVREYDERMAHWARFSEQEVDGDEQDAVERVFALLISREAATLDWGRSMWTTRIVDAEALAAHIGIPVSEVLEGVDWFADGDETVVSPEGTLRLAEYACRVNPMPVLDAVIEEEKGCRDHSKRDASGRRGGNYSPEWEYDFYLKHIRPVHELLRAWCGHRAVTLQERLTAAESEVRRLDGLLARVLGELKRHNNSIVAEVIEQERVEGRITPEKARPIVDRPLKPSEIPVRYERAPRRWGRW